MRLIIKLIKFLEDLTLLTLRIFPAEAAKNITLNLLKLIYSLNLINLFASSNFEISNINIKNLKMGKGIKTWKDEKFDSEIERCRRVWPHHNDTDGFFIARIEKC